MEQDQRLFLYLRRYLIEMKNPIVIGAAFLNRDGDILAFSGLTKEEFLLAQYLIQIQQIQVEGVRVDFTELRRVTLILRDRRQIILASPECDDDLILFALVPEFQALGLRFLAISNMFKALCTSPS